MLYAVGSANKFRNLKQYSSLQKIKLKELGNWSILVLPTFVGVSEKVLLPVG